MLQPQRLFFLLLVIPPPVVDSLDEKATAKDEVDNH
jgi:hypothetical protein